MNATELLQAIARHFELDGTELNATSPLIAAAQAFLTSTSPEEAARPLVQARVGLSADALARRRHTLGSSEIAAVCELSPYQSAHDVWASKVLSVDFAGNEATHLGNMLEGAIFAVYADRYGKTLTKGEYTLGPEDWMSCTPDATIDGEDGLVEAKLVGLRSIFMWGPGNDEEHESDAVPMHYLIQALWQLAVTGRAFVDVSALLGTEFRTYRIHRNEDVQRSLIERGRAFWMDHVKTAIPPPVDGSEGATRLLKKLYPRSGGAPVQATPELDALARDILAARERLAEVETEQRRLENEMKSRLGEASGARGNGWHARYRETKDHKRPFVLVADRA